MQAEGAAEVDMGILTTKCYFAKAFLRLLDNRYASKEKVTNLTMFSLTNPSRTLILQESWNSLFGEIFTKSL